MSTERRLCKCCRRPIPVHRQMDMSKLALTLHFEDFAAWLASFCSRVCQINQALDDVVNGRAWWQREGE